MDSGKKIIIFISLVILFVVGISLPKLLKKISTSKLYINEILASNKSIIEYKGDFYDYIELYNASGKAINLEGYFLSDNEEDLTKWVFPDVTIESHDYLLVFASGLDFCDEYCHTNFKLSSNGELIILSDPKENIISKIEYPMLTTDVSYGYIDGEYKKLYNPSPLKENIDEEHSESDITNTDIEISEYITHNKSFNYDKHGNYFDWIELHNISGKEITLDGLYLTDDDTKLSKFKIPRTILKDDQYLIMYFSGDKLDYDDDIYIPFSLSENDKSLIISDGEEIITSVNIVKLLDNMSYGKVDNEYKYFTTPTPGKANKTAAFSVLKLE